MKLKKWPRTAWLCFSVDRTELRPEAEHRPDIEPFSVGQEAGSDGRSLLPLHRVVCVKKKIIISRCGNVRLFPLLPVPVLTVAPMCQLMWSFDVVGFLNLCFCVWVFLRCLARIRLFLFRFNRFPNCIDFFFSFVLDILVRYFSD